MSCVEVRQFAGGKSLTDGWQSHAAVRRETGTGSAGSLRDRGNRLAWLNFAIHRRVNGMVSAMTELPYDYTLMAEGGIQEQGSFTMASVPSIGDHQMFGGTAWKIVHIDPKITPGSFGHLIYEAGDA